MNTSRGANSFFPINAIEAKLTIPKFAALNQTITAGERVLGRTVPKVMLGLVASATLQVNAKQARVKRPQKWLRLVGP